MAIARAVVHVCAGAAFTLLLTLHAPAALAFSLSNHESLTTSALKDLGFCPEIADSVSRSNLNVDRYFFYLSPPHCDGELIAECHDLVLERRQGVLNLLASYDSWKDLPARPRARLLGRVSSPWQALGEALHTLQDFYSHSNWVDIRGGVNPSVGTPGATVSNPSPTSTPCPTGDGSTLNNVNATLTTGYFDLLNGESFRGCDAYDEVRAGKCAHGFGFGCQGINKDKEGNGPSPGAHAAAMLAAGQATRDFVTLITSSLPEPQKNLLMFGSPERTSCGPDIAFVVDVSGSMGDDIAAVRAGVAATVASIQGGAAMGTREVSRYILTTFSDPGCGNTAAYTEAGTFLAAIDSIFVSGGGDCPELLYCGLAAALADIKQALPVGAAKATPGSRVYVYTDATAKDASSADASRFRALQGELQVPVSFLLTGVCTDAGGVSRRRLLDVADVGTPALVGLMPGSDPYSVTATEETAGGVEQLRSLALQSGGLLYLSTDISELESIVSNVLDLDLMELRADIANLELAFELPFTQTFCNGTLLEWSEVCVEGGLFEECAVDGQAEAICPRAYAGPDVCEERAVSLPVDTEVSALSFLITGPLTDAEPVLTGPLGAPFDASMPGVSITVGALGSVIYRLDGAALSAGPYSLSVCYVGPNAVFQVKVVGVSPFAALAADFFTAPADLLLQEQLGPLRVLGAPRSTAEYAEMQVIMRGDMTLAEDVTMYYADAAAGVELNGTRRPMSATRLGVEGSSEVYLLRTAEAPAPVPDSRFAAYVEFSLAGETIVRAAPNRFEPLELAISPEGHPVKRFSGDATGATFAFLVESFHSSCTNVSVSFTIIDGEDFEIVGNDTVVIGVTPNDPVPVFVKVAQVAPLDGFEPPVPLDATVVASVAPVDAAGTVGANAAVGSVLLQYGVDASTCPEVAEVPECFGRGLCVESGQCACLTAFSGPACEGGGADMSEEAMPLCGAPPASAPPPDPTPAPNPAPVPNPAPAPAPCPVGPGSGSGLSRGKRGRGKRGRAKGEGEGEGEGKCGLM